MTPANPLRRTGEIAAIVVLVMVGARTGWNWHAYRVQTKAARSMLVGALAKPGVVLDSLTGIDLQDQRLMPRTDPRTRIVFVLLRSRSGNSDLAFWNRVARSLGGVHWLQFRAFCEDAACVAAARTQREFMVLRAGAIREVEAVQQADHDGNALLVAAADGAVLRDIPWRRGESPEQVADAVEAP